MQARYTAAMKSNFLPLFVTQFLGALNDNLYKNGLVMLIAVQQKTLGTLGPQEMVILCGAIFILPFFCFSALAGEIADRFSKSQLVVVVKVFEVLAMLLATLGLILDNLPLLLVTLFLMGLHSSFFGPVKYSILPELVSREELVQSNAYVESGTFLAILLGTIGGGLLISWRPFGPLWLSGAVMIVAILGVWSALNIKPLRPINTTTPIHWNFWRTTGQILVLAARHRFVMSTLVAISWFWFLGAAFLSLLPSYGLDFLQTSERFVTLSLALFSIGVAVGSLLYSRCWGQCLQLGPVVVSALLMSIFLGDLYWLGPLARQGWFFWRLLFDLFAFAVAGGVFIVPLYTLLQVHSGAEERSRIIAANNILNALFMVISALLLMGMTQLGLVVTEIFLILAILNALVVVALMVWEGAFFMAGYRMLLALLVRWLLAVRYQIHVQDRVPLAIQQQGGVLILANHPALIDPVIALAYLGERYQPIVLIDEAQLQRPGMGLLSRGVDLMAIAAISRHTTDLRARLEQVMTQAAAALRSGRTVWLYPSGQIARAWPPVLQQQSATSSILQALHPLRPPVVLLTTRGLWGSSFSFGHTGRYPQLTIADWKRLISAIFKPRRRVQITLELATDFPYEADKVQLNSYLTQKWQDS